MSPLYLLSPEVTDAEQTASLFYKINGTGLFFP